MLTKGMLMVIIGIGGLVITVIVAIVLLIVMRRKELKAKNEVNELNRPSSNSGLNGSIGQRTDILGTESIINNGKVNDIIPESGTDLLVWENATIGMRTDVLVSEQIASRTDILELQGTEVLMNQTTVISD